MRPADFTAIWAQIAWLVVFTSVLIVHEHEGQVPFLVGLWLAVLLLLGAAMSCLAGCLDQTPGEGRRRIGKPSFSRGLASASLSMAIGGLPFAGVFVLYRGQWALIMPVLAGTALCVLTLVSMYRERKEPLPPAPEPTPKLVGLLPGTRLPGGWISVYVYRPASQLHDASVDYRVHMDGARVGTLGAGEVLLSGLTAGPHVIQGWTYGYSSPPLHLRLTDGDAVYLVLEPDGSILDAVTKIFDRGRYLRLTRRDQLWVATVAGVQQTNPWVS